VGVDEPFACVGLGHLGAGTIGSFHARHGRATRTTVRTPTLFPHGLTGGG
jgi:hypothetical protein